LNADQGAELLAAAASALAASEELYPFATFGPAGITIFSIDTDRMTRTVEYQLPIGNLLLDPDTEVQPLPDLTARLGHFSAEIDEDRAHSAD
jgi:hypothetical protein